MSFAATALVTALGAGCAAGTLWLARRAEQAERLTPPESSGAGAVGSVAARSGEVGSPTAGAGGVSAAAAAVGAASGGAASGGAASGGGASVGGGASGGEGRWWEAEPWWESLSEDERRWVVRNLAEAGHAPEVDVD
ncbi:hypothetical protein [Cryptosporangium arvum]|uniref:hypothetical protein n=1 Tax=Cryptosporangium arvum TaxID=80871 RepID=UPI0004B77BBA|nr:hypothetical protein [Cryptosporangium arvum]